MPDARGYRIHPDITMKTKVYDGAAALERTTPKNEIRNGRKVLTRAYEKEVLDALRMGWPLTETGRVYGVSAKQLRDLAEANNTAVHEDAD